MSRYHLVCRDCTAEGVHDNEDTAVALAARHVDEKGHEVLVGEVTDE